MGRAVVDFLNELEARLATEELETATALLLEVEAAGGRFLYGPFPKDVATVFEAIERLSDEEDPEAQPNVYNVLLLQPVSQTFPPHPEYPVDPSNGELDRCVCGGVRHWHGTGTGCEDDCGCRTFRVAQ